MAMTADWDTKVMEMKFNNKQFEESIKQSSNSLEKFQSILDNLHGGDSIDKISKAFDKIDMSGIENGIYALQEKFSAFGVAGMTVIYRLTNSLMNFGKSLWNMSFGQIKSGGWNRALNIQQAEYMLEGLHLDVEQVKNDALAAVKGTAFGFDEAAKAAANFGASGIKAGKEMEGALRGVAGVAAMTSSDFSSIADIFSTVASNGKLMTMQLRQFATRGLNVSAELAKVMHKTEAQINDMVSKGQISFKQFAAAMDEAFGEHAKDANKTFSGSLSNVKAALSRIGADFAGPIIDDMVPVLNSLMNSIDKIHEDLMPLVKQFQDWSKIITTVFDNMLKGVQNSKSFANIFKGLEHIFMGIVTVLYAMKKGFNEAFPQIKSLSDLFRVLTIYLIPTREQFNGLVNIFKIFFSAIKIVVDFVKVGANIFLAFAAVVYKLVSLFLGLAASISDMIDPYIKWIKENNVVEGILYAVISAIYDLVQGSEVLSEIFDKLFNSGKNAFDFFFNLMSTVGNVAETFLSFISSIDLSKIALIAFIVSLAFVAESIYQFVNRIFVFFGGFLYTFYNMFKQIGNIFLDVHKILTQVFNLIKLAPYEMIADIILRVAISVGILAVSLKLLSTIDTGSLIKAGIALAVLAGGVVGLAAAFLAIYGKDSLFKTFGIAALAGAIVAMTAGISVLSIMLKLISTISKEDIVKSIVTIYAIGALMVAISKLSTATTVKGGILQALPKNFLSIALAMTVMAVAIRIIAGADKNIGAAVLSMIAMGILMEHMAKISVIAKGMKNMKPGIFTSLAASLLIMSLSLRILADIEDPQRLEDAMVALGILAVAVMAMAWIQQRFKLGGLNTKGFISLALTLSLMTGCLVILSGLALLPNDALFKGVLAIYALEAGIAAMVGVSALWQSGINASGFIKMAATLAILTGCLVLLSVIAAISPSALENAVGAIFMLEIAVAAMAAVQNYFSLGAINSSGFIKFAATIAIMSGALLVLSLIDPDNIWNAIAAMGFLVLLSAGMMAVSEAFTGIKSAGFLAFAGTMLILSIAVSVLVQAVGDNYAGLWLSVLAIGALTFIVYEFAKMSQGMKDIHTFGFLTFAAAVLVLSGAVAILASIPDTDKMLTAAVAIAGMIVALSFAARESKDFNVLAGTGLLIFSSAILVLAAALAIVASLDIDKIAVGVIAIIGLGMAMGMLSGIMSEISPAYAASIVILAAGMFILSGALVILAQVPWPQLLTGAGVLALLILTLSVAGNIAQYAGAGLMALSAAMISFGAAMLLTGAGIYLMAAAFNEFSLALHNLATLSEADINQIINNINLFVVGLGSVCDNIVAMAPKFAMAFGAIGLAISAAVGVIVLAVSNYAVLGMILFAALLVAYLPEILDALGQIMDATGLWFQENSDKVYEFGRELGQVFVDGILGACEGIAEAIYDKIWGRDVKESYENWKKVGEEAGNIYKQNMLKAMDMYKDGQYSADMLVAGLKAGLENGYITEEEAMKELANRGLESFQDELGIHSPSLEMIKDGEYTIQGVIEGVRNKEYSFEQAMAAMAEGGVKAFQSKFSSADMLGGITSSLGIGLGSTGGWYDTGMKVAGGQYVYQREGYSSIDDYVDAKQMQDRAAMYNSIKKELMESLGIDANAMDDLTDSTAGASGALGDYSSEADKATKATDSMSDSIKDTLDVFTAFNDEAKMSGREVLQTFVTQIKGVNKWSEELQALSTKGLNANFLQELADQGPAAYEKIHALYTMTDHELSLFNQMYAHKIVLERGTAKTIRDSFVKNGAMTVEAAEKFGENIADGAAKKVAESGEKISASEKKALEEAEEELAKKKIDEEFVAKWAGEISSDTNQMTLKNAFTELGYASMQALEKSTSFEVIMDKLILFKNSVKEQAKGALKLFETVETQTEEEKKKAQISTTQMLYNMAENTKKIGAWSYNIRKMIKMGFSEGLIEELRQLGPESADKVDAFIRMNEKEVAMANRYYKDAYELPERVSDRMTTTYAQAGFDVSLGLKKGLDEGKDDLLFAFQDTGYEASQGFVKGVDPEAANDVMKQLGSNSLSALKEALDSHSPSKKAEEIGMWFVEGFTLKEQMDWALRTIANTMGIFATTAIDKLSEYLSKSKTMEIAKSFLEGFNVGLVKYSSLVGDTIGSVGGSIVKSFSAALGVNSPSVIAEDIMNYFLEGALIPLTNDETVANAAKSKAETIADMFKQGITDGGMDGDVYEPVIRPVWDDINVANGLNNLTNKLNGFDISGTINNAYASQRTGPSPDAIIITNAIREMAADNRAIRQELSNLRTDTSNLANRIDGMYVRLDGNALVGELVAPLDKAMGKKVITQKRGRM